jgi:nucleoside-diphosphate-sugar epimerase
VTGVQTCALRSASLKNNIEKYFFSSSACVYNESIQKKIFIPGLKESDAYPAEPVDGYGWEKLFSERMCRHFTEDYKLSTRVARFHNIYGPMGTFDGGREKAPAALCRKVINAKINAKKSIEIWGDGKQTRSFMYIDDCIAGVKKIFSSKFSDVFNLGSEEQVSINEMVDIIQEIAEYNVKKIYQLDKPQGVRGRSSDNSFVNKRIGWKPNYSLRDGLEKTYKWIYDQMVSGSNIQKFTRK